MNAQNIKAVLPLDWLIATGQQVTQENAQAAEQAQRYQNRERIPEPVLWMADLYNELTGQEPTKRVLSDWLLTFEEWRQEGLQAEHLRAAWQQSNDINKGFHVGRPGALTVTAVAIKSKTNKPATLKINEQRIQETKRAMEEKWSGAFVPRPATVQRPANLAPRRIRK